MNYSEFPDYKIALFDHIVHKISSLCSLREIFFATVGSGLLIQMFKIYIQNLYISSWSFLLTMHW